MRRLFLALFCCAVAVRAQEEPTPFWMPPPPPSKQAPARPKKKKKPVQVQPLKSEKPKKPPAAREPPSPKPSWIMPPSRAAEPLPRPEHAPVEVEPAPPPAQAAPADLAPSPGATTVVTPAPAPEPRALTPVPSPPAATPMPAPPTATPTPAAPAATPMPASPAATPAPLPAPPTVTPVPAPSSSEAPAAVILVEPEAEARADDVRRWSIDAAFGVWGKPRSDGSGRDWQLAYGLRFGRALFPSLELEIELLRAGGSAGNPFVSASATHNLAALRAFWVLGSAYALLLGGGGGVAVSQTHYLLQPTTDPGAVATGLDANALKAVIQITAAGRARLFRGLEARAEVSILARDGRLELVPLLGAGAAF